VAEEKREKVVSENPTSAGAKAEDSEELLEVIENDPVMGPRKVKMKLPFCYWCVAEKALDNPYNQRYTTVYWDMENDRLFSVSFDKENGDLAPQQKKGTIKLFRWDSEDEKYLEAEDLKTGDDDKDYNDWINDEDLQKDEVPFSEYLGFVTENYKYHLTHYLVRLMKRQNLVTKWKKQYKRALMRENEHLRLWTINNYKVRD